MADQITDTVCPRRRLRIGGLHQLLLCSAMAIFPASGAFAQATPGPDAPAPQTGTTAAPQTSEADEDSLTGDIIVTANRRNESAQRTALSITAFNGDQLTRLGVTNASDIAKITPAVSIYQIHPSVTNINIRGVSQNYFADHLEAPIAVYVDDAYIGSTVRRQNIWHNSRRRFAECGPRLRFDVRRRACGVASADVRVSFA